jgi:hypothetical protein
MTIFPAKMLLDKRFEVSMRIFCNIDWMSKPEGVHG